MGGELVTEALQSNMKNTLSSNVPPALLLRSWRTRCQRRILPRVGPGTVRNREQSLKKKKQPLSGTWTWSLADRRSGLAFHAGRDARSPRAQSGIRRHPAPTRWPWEVRNL